MKYLITGITGFAGPHLAQLLLKENHEVHGLIRATSGRETDLLDLLTTEELNAITFQKVDLLHYARLEAVLHEEQYDGVFHLASQSHPGESFKDPIKTFQDNVMGSVNLIEAIETHSRDTNLMFCSTSEVYGDQCRDTGILYESDAIKPCNPYGVTKASIDLFMQERMQNGFINGFITRAFSHTGPRRFKNFSISSDAYQLAVMMKNGVMPLRIGNLQTHRVVMDVRDTVRAYYLLMQKCNQSILGSNKGIFNVCGDVVHKMEYFTDMLIDFSGLKGVKKVIEPAFYRDIDIQVQIGDCSKLQQMTGWNPKYEIYETLDDLLQYWKNKV